MRGHGDDRQVLFASGADALDRPESVHDRHLDIHEHGVVVLGQGESKGLLPVVRDGHPDVRAFENLSGHLLVDRVVLGQEDVCTGQVRGHPGLLIVPGQPVPVAGVVVQGVHDGVEKDGPVERLEHESVHARLFGLVADRFLSVGGEHDDLGFVRDGRGPCGCAGVSSMPSVSGMLQSVMTSRNGAVSSLWASRARASTALPASSTSKVKDSKTLCKTMRDILLSSTTRTCIPLMELGYS